MRRNFVYLPTREQKSVERGADVSWDALLASLLAVKREDCGEKHLYDLENALRRAHKGLQSLGCDRPILITKDFARKYLASYKATGVKDQSVRHMAVKLIGEFRVAYLEEIFDRHLLATLRPPKVRDKNRINPVTLDEIGLIVEAIYAAWSPEHAPASRFRGEDARAFFAARDACMTLWLPETGCRIGETCEVKMADLNLEARTAKLKETKNGDDRLTCWTQGFADWPLSEWLAIRQGLDTLTDYLFITEEGLKINPYRWGRQWDQYRQRAGIERRIRRHDLRHFASTAHDRVDESMSMKLMGHHTKDAHQVYSHREVSELVAMHDQAAPIAPLLEKRKAAAEARAAAEKPKRSGRRVYTKAK